MKLCQKMFVEISVWILNVLFCLKILHMHDTSMKNRNENMKREMFFTYPDSVGFPRKRMKLSSCVLFAQQKNLMNRYICVECILGKISKKKKRWRRRPQQQQRWCCLGINGGDTFSPLCSALLSLCECWMCALFGVCLCWRAIIKSHCNFLCWCPLNLFACLPCQPIATSSYSSYSHEYARRFMIRSWLSSMLLKVL